MIILSYHINTRVMQGQTIYTQYYVKTPRRGGQKYYRKNKNEKKIEFNQT